MVNTTKTDICKIKGSWEDVVDDCRLTVNRPPLGHEPSSDFKRRILIAEHSPIRDLWIRWKWCGIKYWIAMHWKTHHWESKVTTQRTDRTGTDRDEARQDAPVDFVGEANPQHLIDSWRKRLCYQASPETREYAEDFKTALYKTQPEISDALVPNCIYRCGCPEMQCCGYFNRLLAQDEAIRSTNFQARYSAYNRIFWKNHHIAERDTLQSLWTQKCKTTCRRKTAVTFDCGGGFDAVKWPDSAER